MFLQVEKIRKYLDYHYDRTNNFQLKREIDNCLFKLRAIPKSHHVPISQWGIRNVLVQIEKNKVLQNSKNLI